MDPVLFSLPEVILNDREELDCTQAGSLSFSHFSPRYHQQFSADRSASQEELDIHKLSEPSLPTSHEIIGRVGQFCPSEPHLVMDESASLRASTVAEMLRRIANSDQRTDTQSWTQRDLNPNQQSVQHLIPSFKPQIQAQDCPSPVNLQTLSPGARSQSGLTPLLPELLFTSCSPQDSCWLNMSPVASTPPYVLVPVSSPTEFWYSPYLPPHSWLLLPEVRPSWCLCPQTVHVHQPCSPDLVSRRTALQVSEQLNVSPESAVSGEEQSGEHASTEEEQQKNCTPDKDKLQANNTDDKTTKSKVSPESRASLDEESLAELAFEEYMMIMDSLSAKIQEEVEAKENEEGEDDEKEELKIENGSFLDYLDELCSDEDFVRKVESELNMEYLDSLLSPAPESIDLLALEKQEQEVGSTLNTEYLDSLLSPDPEPIDFIPLRELQQQNLEVILQELSHPPSVDSNSDPVTEETSPVTSHVEESAPPQRAQSPILDPPGRQSDANPNHNGQNAPLSTRDIGSKEGWSSCSPLLLSSPLLDESLPIDPTPKYYNPVNAVTPLYHSGSLFMDYSLNSSLQLLANISPDTSLTSDLEARDNNALLEVPAAIFPTGDVSEESSMSLSNPADTQSALTSQELQEGPLESLSTSRDSGSNEDPHTIAVKDPAPSFIADLLTVSPPQSAVLAFPRPLPPPPALIGEREEQCCPKNINTMPSCLEDHAVPVPANSSFVADSHAESCDPTVDGNLSDSVPEKQTVEPPKGLQVSQEFASSGVSSELRAAEWGEMERKCEKNLAKGVVTTLTQKQTAIKAREEGMTENTFERKEENKENETKLKGTTNTRRSQRLSGQIEKEKARLSGGLIIERTEERKPSEKSTKKTAKFTPERDMVISKNQKRRSSGGRQFCKREESNFEEWSQAKTANTVEQFSETGEKEQHQKLTGEIQKLKVEGGEQCEANNPSVSTEIGAENALLTTMAQEEKELGEGRVKRKQEGIQIPSFVRRRTRSTTAEEKVQLTPGARGKIKHSEIERSETKSSPKREMQDDNKLEVNVKEDATEQQTLPVSSQMKRSRRRRDGKESRERANDANSTGSKTNEDKVSGNCSAVSLPESSLQSPRAQTDSHSTKDSIKDDQSRQESPKGLLKNPNLTPALCPQAQPQSKTVASSGCEADRQTGRGETGHHGEVTGTETWDFYSLRSLTHKPNVSKRTGIQENKATRHSSNPKPSPDQTADVKGEDEGMNGEEAERQSLMSSPMKRYWHERGASEERETRVNETVRSMDEVGIETETISSSPIKRGRWKSRVEVNSKRDEEQKLTSNEKGKLEALDEAETSGCRPSTPSTRSKIKAQDEKISNVSSLAGQETSDGDNRSVKETRTSRKGTRIPCFPCKRQTRLSEKLPTKYKDFVLCKTNTQKRQLDKDKVKAGKGRTLRGGKKVVN